jgi:hypothetical protein
MKSHRRYLRRLRTMVMLALCVPLSAPAGALAAPAVHRPTQQTSAIVGDSPADFAQPVAPAPTAGEVQPARAHQVVRPERTIVRNANQALPTVLAGLALLVALGGAGFVLVRTRSLQRGVVGRSH